MTFRPRAALVACALMLTPLVALQACSTVAATHVALTPAQAAQRAMLAAEVAFNTAATAELDAKGTGLISGDRAVKADAIRKQAYQVLLGLRAVYAAGKAPDVASLLALTNQLLLLAGQTPPAVAFPVVPTL